MRRILTYKLFEGVPFTRENIQKSIRDKINESEVELIITDICADFMDEYNVAIHFNWGWAVSVDQIKRGGVWHGEFDFRRDSTVDLIRKSPSQRSDPSGEEYLKEVDESSTRYVEVMFDRYDRGYTSGSSTSELKIWKRGFDLDFLNIMDFVRNYFPNAEIKQQGNITSEAMACRFNVIFK